ncbi:hypothetical protein MNBD_BACTEROID03-2275 [hydrothermal vent metagenome]|uniref:Uncharacterized protein n=1 Tax=hydrothermal vent metagenome TaxID=652676 RepID=A0A3B0SZQ5_9ZZZZ
MKTLVLIVLFSAFTSNLKGKKKVVPYPVAICKADLVVVGEIASVSSSVLEYDFQITEFIKGKSEQKITVAMWAD